MHENNTPLHNGHLSLWCTLFGDSTAVKPSINVKNSYNDVDSNNNT